MIRIDKSMVETKGPETQLLTEMTLGVKRLCMIMGREFVIPTILSAIYSIRPEGLEKDFNLKEVLEEFKKDTTKTLEYIEFYANLDGKNPFEKFNVTREEIEEMEKNEHNND